jgi:hypothetical protein
VALGRKRGNVEISCGKIIADGKMGQRVGANVNTRANTPLDHVCRTKVKVSFLNTLASM